MDKSNPVKVKKDLTTKLRENPFILSTIIFGVLAIFFLIIIIWEGITGGAISEYEAMDTFEKFASSQIEGVEVLGAERDGDLYRIDFNSSQTGESIVYMTADGRYLVTGLLPLSIIENIPKNNTQSILECAEPYGISSDTIIFYYSNSCGWCTKMKPGVEALEEEGYKFHWVEVSDTEASELIDNCIRDYMTGGGVPQFICPKTEEIYIGAFVDEEGNLNQLALKEWADNCIN